MAYGYQRPDPKDVFRNWLDYQINYIKIATDMGFTEDQAIELIKIYALTCIEDKMNG